MKVNNFRPGLLAFLILIPLCVGGLSTLISGDMKKNYFFYNKPALSPPGWLFPIVWTVLYVMMGIAIYLVITSDADKSLIRRAVFFFSFQLVLNFFWSILFFKYSLYLCAFIELAVMWIAIVICTVYFFRISKASGTMMIPYILWTTFAGYLNFAIYKLSITPMPIHK